MELISFIPITGSYQIWYPKQFLINEDDGIVSIISSETYSNLTLSSYQANTSVNESVLLNFLQNKTKNYLQLSEIKSAITVERIWLEGEFKNEKAFWIWSALSQSNQIILTSINSNDPLSEEDRHLYTFMLDKMEIYPDSSDQ